MNGTNVMNVAYMIINWINVIFALVVLYIQVMAFLDCLRRKGKDFERIGRSSHIVWILLTGGSLLLGIFFLIYTLQQLGFFPNVTLPTIPYSSLLGYAAAIAPGIYLAGVKPQLQAIDKK